MYVRYDVYARVSAAAAAAAGDDDDRGAGRERVGARERVSAERAIRGPETNGCALKQSDLAYAG